MLSSNGKAVPNQFILTDDDRNRFFQSYKSVIAEIGQSGCIYLDIKFWDFSVTTSKYRNQFLNLTTTEIKDKIKNGSIVLVNLNDDQL